jgi:hypothetical protein
VVVGASEIRPLRHIETRHQILFSRPQRSLTPFKHVLPLGVFTPTYDRGSRFSATKWGYFSFAISHTRADIGIHAPIHVTRSTRHGLSRGAKMAPIVENINGTSAQANPDNVFKPVGQNTFDMAILNNIKVKGEVLTPGDKGYEESVKRWAGNAERKAGYVVFVENAEDISNTVFPSFGFF